MWKISCLNFVKWSAYNILLILEKRVKKKMKSSPFSLWWIFFEKEVTSLWVSKNPQIIVTSLECTLMSTCHPTSKRFILWMMLRSEGIKRFLHLSVESLWNASRHETYRRNNFSKVHEHVLNPNNSKKICFWLWYPSLPLISLGESLYLVWQIFVVTGMVGFARKLFKNSMSWMREHV